jgi:predicted alpha/beta hydrolase
MQLIVDRGTDRLSVQVYPVTGSDAPLVVILPAMGVPAGYYERFVKDLNAAGMGVAVADLRGTGQSSPRPSRASRYGYAELTDDVAAVLEALAEHRTGRRTLLLGHSLGGQAGLLHLARTGDTGVDGLVLIATGLPYWRTYPGPTRFGVLGFTQAINVISAGLQVWPGWSFGGRQARGIIRDWAYTARAGRFPAHLGAEDRLADITVPVLALSVDDDQYTPPSTTDHLVAKLTGARVQRAHLSRDEAGIVLDHFKWVKAGQLVATRISDWLQPARLPS